MPDFRCNMLDERGGTLFSEDINADTLESAILHASNTQAISPRCHGVYMHSKFGPARAGSSLCRLTHNPSSDKP
jgi:hypothetical protein